LVQNPIKEKTLIMKSIISWKDFLVEKQLDLFQGTSYERPELKYGSGSNGDREGVQKFWPISYEEVGDLLFELEENGYSILIFYEFVDESDKDEGPKNLVIPGNKRELTPCIRVQIAPKVITRDNRNELSDEDLTYVITSFVKRVRQKFKTIEFFDDEGFLNLKDIRIKGGLEYELEPDDIVTISELNMNLIWYNPVYFTDKMVIEYHKLDDKVDIAYDDKGQSFITYPAEDYTEWLISSRDDYYDYLSKKNGFESLWENYWDYAEQPSVKELFDYYLNTDTVKLLVDYLVEDFESLEEIDADEYETLTGFGITTKEQLIERVQKIGLVNIGKLLDKIDSDFISDIRSMYSDMSVSATVDGVQEKIVSALEDVIEEQLETRVTKTEWKDGHPYITMKFNIDWLERYDGEDEYLHYVIGEYISNNYLGDNKLRVYSEDMGSPDGNEFNKEVKSMIINIMKRNGREFKY
jgi:hypothetical protein